MGWCSVSVLLLLGTISLVLPHVSATCTDTEYPCPTSDTCIPLSAMCDGHEDCPNGSDETHQLCSAKSCPESSFQCHYGACVPLKERCNGVMNCADGSDERPTTCPNITVEPVVCLSDEFRCESGDQCIWLNTTCNGKQDCEDGSDETAELCQETKCPDNSIRCGYGGCAVGGSFCDMYLDCFDLSDEDPLICAANTNCSSHGDPEVWDFQCRSQECIKLYKQCDGKKDCKDGSDEGEKCQFVRSCNPYEENVNYECVTPPCQRKESLKLTSGSVVQATLQCNQKALKICYNGNWLDYQEEDEKPEETRIARQRRSNAAEPSADGITVQVLWPQIGGTVRLACPMATTYSYVHWFRDEFYYITPWTRNVSPKYDTEADDYVLVIRNVTRADSDSYTCETKLGRAEIILFVGMKKDDGGYNSGLEKGVIIAIAIMIAILILCVAYLIQYAIPTSRQWKLQGPEHEPLT